jgi:hypothetical protein
MLLSRRRSVEVHFRVSGIAGRSKAGEIVVGDEELVNAGLSAIPGEGDIHAPILRLSLGRVVRYSLAAKPGGFAVPAPAGSRNLSLRILEVVDFVMQILRRP